MHWVFLHYHEHTYCSLFWLNPTYAVLLLLTKAPNVDESSAESPQQMHHFLLFD